MQLSDTAQSQSSTYPVQSYVKYISDMQQLYIADVLVWKLVNGSTVQKSVSQQHVYRDLYSSKCLAELNTSDLVQLLQQAAVEHLTTSRQLEARDFGSIITIVTTDFEAMYAYKRGDYQRCLQFCCLHRTYTRCCMLLA